MKTVLIINDDGPCDNMEAPFLFTFVQTLRNHLVDLHGSCVRIVVVTPAAQQSWVGKGMTRGNKLEGRRWTVPAELKDEADKMTEVEWFTIQGSPATTAHIAYEYLHILSPRCAGRQVDLVISGPNKGRNSGAPFALASGTLGAAMEIALKTKSIGRPLPVIALSFGLKEWNKWTDTQITDANNAAVNVIQTICQKWPLNGAVQLYSINVPLCLSSPASPKVYSTTLNCTNYPSLYHIRSNSISSSVGSDRSSKRQKTTTSESTKQQTKQQEENEEKGDSIVKDDEVAVFEFGLLDLKAISEVKGTDAWCVSNGYISVSPLLARFAEAGSDGSTAQCHLFPVFSA